VTTQQDLAKLNQTAQVLASGTLRNIVNEVQAVTPLVVAWTPVNTSGSAVCRYNENTGGRQYEVRYQIGDIGNLVHELTHVAVNESYGLDFVNYPNAHAKDVPARDLDAHGRCKNEESRQTKQMAPARNNKNIQTLQTLQLWASKATELKPDQRKQVGDKLTYGMMNPQKEYDTVINQVLVWLFEWGYPIKGASPTKKPVVNALYEEIEKAAKTAYEERQREKNRTIIRDSMTQRRAAMGYGK